MTKPRTWMASDSLVAETLELAKCHGWSGFCSQLYVELAEGQLKALQDVRDTAVAVNRERYERETGLLKDQFDKSIQSAEVRVAKAESTGASLSEADACTAIKTLLNEFWALAWDLPVDLRFELDDTLVRAHRQRMAAGLEGHKEDHLAQIHDQTLHPHALVGLALSGGGIRSASFAIGVMQQMAKAGLLSAFHCVSGVSGGGYAASWLTTWAYRHKEGIHGVQDALHSHLPTGRGPVHWFRRYGSYLAPTSGVVSADSWALLVGYLRNWAPILAFVLLAIATVVQLPAALVDAASGIRARWESGSWAVACVIVLTLMLVSHATYLRTLTLVQTDRHETHPKRSPAPWIIVWTLSTSFLLAVAIPRLPATFQNAWAALALGSFLPDAWSQWAAAVAVGVTLYLSAVVLALLLSWLKSRLGNRLLGAVVDRRRGHAPYAVVGAVFGGLLGGGLLLLALNAAPALIAWQLALSPLAVVSILGISETPTVIATDRYQRDVDRAWSARVGGWMLACAAAWALVFGLALAGEALWEAYSKSTLLTLLGLAVAVGCVAGLAIAAKKRIGLQVVVLAASAVTILLIISAFVSGLQVPAEGFRWWSLPLTLVLALALGSTIDVNLFSLHALYRSGLVRTFLGASRLGPHNTGVGNDSGRENIVADPRGDIAAEKLAAVRRYPIDAERRQFERRTPEQLTDIDDNDDPALKWLVPRAGKRVPLLILSAAINGRSPTDIEGRVPRQWPFSFNPLFCGSATAGIGFVETKEVFGAKNGISLGTAMAVSGAAMSPTSGRTTHPLRAFLAGLLNARLGLWIGNPSHPANAGKEKSPLGGWTILKELLGMRNLFGGWIHLSDGGHFENLGIYELVRRGCRRIVAIDASCDPGSNFEDLANAIRRVQIDLGVEITRDGDWEVAAVVSDRNRLSRRSWMWFDIDYGRGVPRGRLLYLKPSVYDGQKVAAEVRHYRRAAPLFPHESTTDQFFSEKQIEAYRVLGRDCARDMLTTVLDNPDDAESGLVRPAASGTGAVPRQPERIRRSAAKWPKRIDTDVDKSLIEAMLRGYRRPRKSA